MLHPDRTSFVGRRAEVDLVVSAASAARLVTLIGPGGVGKTRLALRAAAVLTTGPAAEAWTVDLARLDAEDLVPNVVAEAVGVTWGLKAPLESLIRALQRRPGILVIDNCEHLLGGVRPTIAALLRACPGVTVIATSRVTLNVRGESVIRVPPMQTRLDPQSPTASEAVRLFVARALSAAPDVELSEDEWQLAADICEALEGLPLAIELAAAQLRVMSLTELRARLADPLSLLVDGPVDDPVSQQSLEGSVRWSYDLCTDAERAGWCALSICSGTFDLPTAQAVLGPDVDALDIVRGLVDKSVVTARARGGHLRYRMLEPVRLFGAERLRSSGGHTRAARAHARHFARRGTELADRWLGPRQAQLLSEFEEDLPNVRTALSYCLETGGHEEEVLGLFAWPFPRIWWTAGRIDEGIYWTDRVLSVQPENQQLLALTHLCGAVLTMIKNDGEASLRHLAAGEAAVAQLDIALYTMLCHLTKGYVHMMRGEHDEAYEQAVIARQAMSGRLPGSRAYLSYSAFLIAALNCTGRIDEARSVCEETVALCEEAGEVYNRANALLVLALIDWGSGDIEVARQRAAMALELAAPFPNRPEVPDMLLTAALLESAGGVTRRAARLSGAFYGARRSRVSTTGIFAPAHPFRERAESCLKATLDQFPFEWEHGIRLERDQALRLARAAMADSDAAVAQQARVDAGTEVVRLTRREKQVARLVAEGYSNQQIASTLTISVRTAEGHVRAVMGKVGAHSRVQVATWVVTDSDGPSPGTSHRDTPRAARTEGPRGDRKTGAEAAFEE